LTPIGLVLVASYLRDRLHAPGVWISKAMQPISVLVLLAASCLGYYFWRVTGNPWTSPYKLNMETYGLVYFPWEKIRAITYHHAVFEEFYRGGAVLGMYNFARQHPVELLLAKATTIWAFFFGPILSLPVLAWIRRQAPP